VVLLTFLILSVTFIAPHTLLIFTESLLFLSSMPAILVRILSVQYYTVILFPIPALVKAQLPLSFSLILLWNHLQTHHTEPMNFGK